MIFSDRQYKVSQNEIDKLKKALASLGTQSEQQEWLHQAQIDALNSQIIDIEAELTEYDMLKSGQVSFSKSFSLEELPRVLVQARISRGLSQSDLAEKLNMKPQQIQRYEATDYMGASLTRLIEVSNALDVKTAGMFEGAPDSSGSMFVWRDADDVAWSQLPYKEMIKRKWFTVRKNDNPVDAVRDYFLSVAGENCATALHRKKMHSGNIPNEYALLAWQARILERAGQVIEREDICEFNLDDRWLPQLIKLTAREDGPKRAKRLLEKHGIVLIVEPHLSGSYLDGAAMLGPDGQPIIGLTLRFDRLDNFWFVLMHELGHVFLHLLDGLRFDFFDEEGAPDSDEIEIEADRFALNNLIKPDVWDQCLSRFALSKEAVLIDAENLGIHPSIIAGRIRKDRKDYTILNDLVGQGQVRSQLKEPDNVLD